MNHDVLTEMLTELREALPTEAQWPTWLEAVSQVIAAYPTDLRRGAATILVANDICVRTGVPLDVCVQAVLKEVAQARGVTR